MNDILPPTPEQWERLPITSQIYIYLLVWYSCFLPRLVRPPIPVHYGLLSSLCMFLLIPIMPHVPLAIPTVIGGGLAGGLLLMGGCYAKATQSN